MRRYDAFVIKETNNSNNNAGGSETLQHHSIASVEGLCVEKLPLRSLPKILVRLYDEDVLDEDIILSWALEGEGGHRRSEYRVDFVNEKTKF